MKILKTKNKSNKPIKSKLSLFERDDKDEYKETSAQDQTGIFNLELIRKVRDKIKW